MSAEVEDDVEAQAPPAAAERRQTSPWNYAFSGLFSRLAEAAEASGARAERRERSLEASTSGRGEQDLSPAFSRTASATRSLGGILRQLQERQEAREGRAENTSETAAAAAERHRLTGTSSTVDFQALTLWVEKNALFIFILICVFVTKHVFGILTFSMITAILAAANNLIRKQIALKEGREVERILGAILVLSVAVIALLLIPNSCLSWRATVLLLPSKIDTVWDCLFCIAIADGVLRSITMIAKLALVAFGPSSPDDLLRRRSQLLTLIEHISLLYRALIPTPLWFVYLYKTRGVLSSVFTGAFLATKCQFVYERANNVASSARSVWRREAQYGKYLSQTELLEIGTSCAICQEHMTRPFQLTHCRHAFCDACLTEWLERQSTCPMCRAVVRPPGLQAFGNGTVSLLPQLF